MCPARGHFIFLTLLIISDFCSANTPGGTDHGRGINDSPSTQTKLADIQKALAHNAWSHILLVHAITGFDTILALYDIGKQKNMFVLEDETGLRKR